MFSIGVTQCIGTPLYLINKDHYYRFMAFTKQCMTLLVLSMTQWWTTTTVHVSGDDSVQGQIHRLPSGRLQCNFASRMVLIANHQVIQTLHVLRSDLYSALSFTTTGSTSGGPLIPIVLSTMVMSTLSSKNPSCTFPL